MEKCQKEDFLSKIRIPELIKKIDLSYQVNTLLGLKNNPVSESDYVKIYQLECVEKNTKEFLFEHEHLETLDNVAQEIYETYAAIKGKFRNSYLNFEVINNTHPKIDCINFDGEIIFCSSKLSTEEFERLYDSIARYHDGRKLSELLEKHS